MPTPIRSFLDVATRYGKVDPNDAEALQRWFTRVLPTLPRETVEEILELLLENEGSSDDAERRGSYPRDVPLPSLSSSPPAPIPLFASGWRELLHKLKRPSKGDGEG
jgi:hypothetical protein